MLLAAFVFQDFAYAGADAVSALKRPAVFDVKFPRSLASVEETYRAPGSAKTIVLIQDAHTNESAQLNIAGAIDVLLEARATGHVFLEAGSGDLSLSYLRPRAPRALRERVARAFLSKGYVQGPDFLDLTSERKFALWGIEDKALYFRGLELYRALREKRAFLEAYLDKTDRAVRTLKPKLYNPELRSFDASRAAFLANELPLTDYFEVLVSRAETLGLPLGLYPHLSALKALRRLESRIDFEKAGEEQLRAVLSLDAADQKLLLEFSRDKGPAKLDAEDDGAGRSFYALLEEKLRGRPGYPNLFRYLRYLKGARKLNSGGIVAEKEALESAIFAALAAGADEKRLVALSRAQEILRKLLNLTLTTDEFREIGSAPAAYDMAASAGFLNRKIMDLAAHHEDALFLDARYDEAVAQAVEFYALTLARDEAFVRNVAAKMDETGETCGVLVAGGFHTPHLKEILKARRFSYVVVTPQVVKETNQKKYETILLSQLRSMPAPAPASSRTPLSSSSRWGIVPARQCVLDDGKAGRPFAVVDLLEAEFTQTAGPALSAARLAAPAGRPLGPLDASSSAAAREALNEALKNLEAAEGSMRSATVPLDARDRESFPALAGALREDLTAALSAPSRRAGPGAESARARTREWLSSLSVAARPFAARLLAPFSAELGRVLHRQGKADPRFLVDSYARFSRENPDENAAFVNRLWYDNVYHEFDGPVADALTSYGLLDGESVAPIELVTHLLENIPEEGPGVSGGRLGAFEKAIAQKTLAALAGLSALNERRDRRGRTLVGSRAIRGAIAALRSRVLAQLPVRPEDLGRVIAAIETTRRWSGLRRWNRRAVYAELSKSAAGIAAIRVEMRRTPPAQLELFDKRSGDGARLGAQETFDRVRGEIEAFARTLESAPIRNVEKGWDLTPIPSIQLGSVEGAAYRRERDRFVVDARHAAGLDASGLQDLAWDLLGTWFERRMGRFFDRVAAAPEWHYWDYGSFRDFAHNMHAYYMDDALAAAGLAGRFEDEAAAIRFADLGSGLGAVALAAAFRPSVASSVAVDASRASLQWAERHASALGGEDLYVRSVLPKLSFARSTLSRLEGVADGSLDVAWSRNTVYSMPSGLRERFFRSAAKKLAPGGTLVVVDHVVPAVAWTPERYALAASEAGLEVVRATYRIDAAGLETAFLAAKKPAGARLALDAKDIERIRDQVMQERISLAGWKSPKQVIAGQDAEFSKYMTATAPLFQDAIDNLNDAAGSKIDLFKNMALGLAADRLRSLTDAAGPIAQALDYLQKPDATGYQQLNPKNRNSSSGAAVLKRLESLLQQLVSGARLAEGEARAVLKSAMHMRPAARIAGLDTENVARWKNFKIEYAVVGPDGAAGERRPFSPMTLMYDPRLVNPGAEVIVYAGTAAFGPEVAARVARFVADVWSRHEERSRGEATQAYEMALGPLAESFFEDLEAMGVDVDDQETAGARLALADKTAPRIRARIETLAAGGPVSLAFAHGEDGMPTFVTGKVVSVVEEPARVAVGFGGGLTKYIYPERLTYFGAFRGGAGELGVRGNTSHRDEDNAVDDIRAAGHASISMRWTAPILVMLARYVKDGMRGAEGLELGYSETEIEANRLLGYLSDRAVGAKMTGVGYGAPHNTPGMHPENIYSFLTETPKKFGFAYAWRTLTTSSPGNDRPRNSMNHLGLIWAALHGALDRGAVVVDAYDPADAHLSDAEIEALGFELLEKQQSIFGLTEFRAFRRAERGKSRRAETLFRIVDRDVSDGPRGARLGSEEAPVLPDAADVMAGARLAGHGTSFLHDRNIRIGVDASSKRSRVDGRLTVARVDVTRYSDSDQDLYGFTAYIDVPASWTSDDIARQLRQYLSAILARDAGANDFSTRQAFMALRDYFRDLRIDGVHRKKLESEPADVRDRFEKYAALGGGKVAWSRITREILAEFPGMGFDVADARYISIEELWAPFLAANADLVDGAREIVEAAAGGNLSGAQQARILSLIGQATFSPALRDVVLGKLSGLKGPYLVRSSHRREDSYEQNLAGLLISERAETPETAVVALQKVLRDTLVKILVNQNSSSRVEGFPNLLDAADGLGFEINTYISDLRSSGTIVSQTHRKNGYSFVEAVAGGAEQAVSKEAVTSQYVMYFNGRPMPGDGRFLYYPASEGAESPLAASRVERLWRIAKALHEKIGVPLDIEWGWEEGGDRPVVLQIRPYPGAFGGAQVIMSSELLDRKRVAAHTPNTLGMTAPEGVTLPVVVFPHTDTYDELLKLVRDFEASYGKPYAGVFTDAATVALLRTAKEPGLCRLYLDVQQNSRNAHNVHALSGVVEKRGLLYANGFRLKDAIEGGLSFEPHPAVGRVLVSSPAPDFDGGESHPFTYFSDGVLGSVLFPKPVRGAPAGRRADLEAFLRAPRPDETAPAPVADKIEPKPAVKPAAPAGKPLVMLVDDDADGADAMATLVTLSGADVQVCYSFNDAIRDLSGGMRPSLLVTDVSAGENVTPFAEIVEGLKKEGRGPSVVVLSGYNPLDRPDPAALRRITDRRVVKPFEPQALMGMVADLMKAAPPAVASAPVALLPAPAKPDKPLALVVDDNEAIARMTTLLLSMGSMRARSALGFGEAMEILEEESPALVVSDIGAGEGLREFMERLAELKEKPGGPTVVIVSGFGTPGVPRGQPDPEDPPFIQRVTDFRLIKPAESGEVMRIAEERARLEAPPQTDAPSPSEDALAVPVTLVAVENFAESQNLSVYLSHEAPDVSAMPMTPYDWEGVLGSRRTPVVAIVDARFTDMHEAIAARFPECRLILVDESAPLRAPKLGVTHVVPYFHYKSILTATRETFEARQGARLASPPQAPRLTDYDPNSIYVIHEGSFATTLEVLPPDQEGVPQPTDLIVLGAFAEREARLLEKTASDARFERAARHLPELRGAGRTDSADVAHLRGILEIPEDQPYLVARHPAGTDFETFVERAERIAMSDSEALDRVFLLAEAVADLNAAGIAHGNLSPRDVFIDVDRRRATITALETAMIRDDSDFGYESLARLNLLRRGNPYAGWKSDRFNRDAHSLLAMVNRFLSAVERKNAESRLNLSFEAEIDARKIRERLMEGEAVETGEFLDVIRAMRTAPAAPDAGTPPASGARLAGSFPTELELITPLDGDSIFDRHIGEGGRNIAYKVEVRQAGATRDAVLLVPQPTAYPDDIDFYEAQPSIYERVKGRKDFPQLLGAIKLSAEQGMSLVVPRDHAGALPRVLVFEYLTKGTSPEGTEEAVHLTQRWTAEQKSLFLRSIADSMRFLRQNNIIHRDLKWANIHIPEELLSGADWGAAAIADHPPVIMDFDISIMLSSRGIPEEGLYRTIYDREEKLGISGGSATWVPLPEEEGARFKDFSKEIMHSRDYDMFAYGLIAAQLAGLEVTGSMRQADVYAKIRQSGLDPRLQRILERLLRKDIQRQDLTWEEIHETLAADALPGARPSGARLAALSESEARAAFGNFRTVRTLQTAFNSLGTFDGGVTIVRDASARGRAAFTLSGEGKEFVWDLMKAILWGDPSVDLAALGAGDLYKSRIADGAIVLTLETSGPRGAKRSAPAGVLAMALGAPVFFDMTEAAVEADIAPDALRDLHRRALEWAGEVSGGVHGAPPAAVFKLRRLARVGAQWLDYENSLPAQRDYTRPTLFHLTASGAKGEMDVSLSPAHPASYDFQFLTVSLSNHDATLFGGQKVGVAGIGGGVTGLLAAKLGASGVYGTDIYRMYVELANWNARFAKDTGQIAESVPFEARLQGDWPAEWDVATILCNAPGIGSEPGSPHPHAVLRQSGYDGKVPMANSFYMPASDFRGFFGALKAQLLASPNTRLVIRIDPDKDSLLTPRTAGLNHPDPDIEAGLRVEDFLADQPELDAQAVNNIFYVIASAGARLATAPAGEEAPGGITDEQLLSWSWKFSRAIERRGEPGGVFPDIETSIAEPDGSENETALYIDFGGTNLRVGSATLNGDRTISADPDPLKQAIPHALVTGGGSTLMRYIAEKVKEYMEARGLDPGTVYKLGFTFSFPLDKRGVSLGFVPEEAQGIKGFDFTDLIARGKSDEPEDVVSILEKELRALGVDNVRITELVNDTESTRDFGQYVNPDTIAGVIVGTGHNIAIRVHGRSVNLETARFGEFERDEDDEELDLLSANPGKQLFEKAVSGKYLGPLAGIKIDRMVREGRLFGGESSATVRDHDFESEEYAGVTSVFLSELLTFDLSAPEGRAAAAEHVRGVLGVRSVDPEDVDELARLADRLVTRSAHLVGGVAFTGIVIYRERTLVPTGRYAFALDGSLLKIPGYVEKIREGMRRVFPADYVNERITLFHAPDGSGAGAAVTAVLAGKPAGARLAEIDEAVTSARFLVTRLEVVFRGRDSLVLEVGELFKPTAGDVLADVKRMAERIERAKADPELLLDLPVKEFVEYLMGIRFAVGELRDFDGHQSEDARTALSLLERDLSRLLWRVPSGYFRAPELLVRRISRDVYSVVANLDRMLLAVDTAPPTLGVQKEVLEHYSEEIRRLADDLRWAAARPEARLLPVMDRLKIFLKRWPRERQLAPLGLAAGPRNPVGASLRLAERVDRDMTTAWDSFEDATRDDVRQLTQALRSLVLAVRYLDAADIELASGERRRLGRVVKILAGSVRHRSSVRSAAVEALEAGFPDTVKAIERTVLANPENGYPEERDALLGRASLFMRVERTLRRLERDGARLALPDLGYETEALDAAQLAELRAETGVGPRIGKAREFRGLAKGALAKSAGVPSNTYASVEGRPAPPNPVNFFALARALRVEPLLLLTGRPAAEFPEYAAENALEDSAVLVLLRTRNGWRQEDLVPRLEAAWAASGRADALFTVKDPADVGAKRATLAQWERGVLPATREKRDVIRRVLGYDGLYSNAEIAAGPRPVEAPVKEAPAKKTPDPKAPDEAVKAPEETKPAARPATAPAAPVPAAPAAVRDPAPEIEKRIERLDLKDLVRFDLEAARIRRAIVQASLGARFDARLNQLRAAAVRAEVDAIRPLVEAVPISDLEDYDRLAERWLNQARSRGVLDEVRPLVQARRRTAEAFARDRVRAIGAVKREARALPVDDESEFYLQAQAVLARAGDLGVEDAVKPLVEDRRLLMLDARSRRRSAEAGEAPDPAGARLAERPGTLLALPERPASASRPLASRVVAPLGAMLSGVAFAQEREADGRDLAIELPGVGTAGEEIEATYIFKLTVSEKRVEARAEGLEPLVFEIARGRSGRKDELTMADLRLMEDALDRVVSERLARIRARAASPGAKVKALVFDLDAIPEGSFESKWTAFAAEFAKARGTYARDGVLELAGDPARVARALKNPAAAGLVTAGVLFDGRATPPDLARAFADGTAVRVRLAGVSRDAAKPVLRAGERLLPMRRLTDRDVPAVRALFELGLALGDADLTAGSRDLDDLASAWRAMSGRDIASGTLLSIVLNAADLATILLHALAPVAPVDIDLAVRYLQYRMNVDRSA